MWAISTTNWNSPHFCECETGGRKAREISICFRNCSTGIYSYFSFPLNDRRLFSLQSAISNQRNDREKIADRKYDEYSKITILCCNDLSEIFNEIWLKNWLWIIFELFKNNYRTRAKIRAGLFKTDPVLDALIFEHFREMLIFEPCLFKIYKKF